MTKRKIDLKRDNSGVSAIHFIHVEIGELELNLSLTKQERYDLIAFLTGATEATNIELGSISPRTIKTPNDWTLLDVNALKVREEKA